MASVDMTLQTRQPGSVIFLDQVNTICYSSEAVCISIDSHYYLCFWEFFFLPRISEEQIFCMFCILLCDQTGSEFDTKPILSSEIFSKLELIFGLLIFTFEIFSFQVTWFQLQEETTPNCPLGMTSVIIIDKYLAYLSFFSTIVHLIIFYLVLVSWTYYLHYLTP